MYTMCKIVTRSIFGPSGHPPQHGHSELSGKKSLIFRLPFFSSNFLCQRFFMNPQICVRQRNSGDNWKSQGRESKREGSKKKLTQLFFDFLSSMLDSHLNFKKVIFKIHFAFSKFFKMKTMCHVFLNFFSQK